MHRKYLIVVAHPDDEVLGCGGTLYKISRSCGTIDMCIMSSEAKARAFRPSDNDLNEDLDASTEMLGIGRKYAGTFPNIEMNNVSHLKLVQFIEAAIQQSQPDVIITHHPCDSNNDHLHTSLACQAAIRLFQRRPEIAPLQEMWFMEVLSSTEWSVNRAMNRFQPDLFIEIGEEGVERKLATLATYRGVMRPYPHPRSEEAVRGLAAFRGAQSGCKFAEAFECVFRRIV